MQHTRSVVTSRTINITHVGVYCICVIDGIKHVMMTTRGYRLSTHANLPFTQGGAIDRGETPEDAAIRETMEESGVDIMPYTLISICVSGQSQIFMVNVDQFIAVCGPTPGHEWEVQNKAPTRDSIMIYTPSGKPSCWFWTPLASVQGSNAPNFIKRICLLLENK
jgi:8-oxo-dGTP pyrophosphatase MutT (NUDIX family)